MKTFGQRYKATIGADFLPKEIIIDDRLITMQIWDTAGQERFQSLSKSYYRGTDALMLCFDVTRKETFKNLDFWKENFFSNSEIESTQGDFPVVVLGNKVDLEGREVKEEVSVKNHLTIKEAEKWCENSGVNFQFFNVSAKDSKNVEQAFLFLAQKVAGRKEVDNEYTITIEESKTPRKQSDSSQCSC